MNDDRRPPVLADAPGHVLRKRKRGLWTVTWRARADLVERGYAFKNKYIAVIGNNPSDAERAFISDVCNRLQDEMLVWGRGGVVAAGVHFDGTWGSLIQCYQTDPASDFHKLRFVSKKNYRAFLKRIDEDHGHELVANFKVRTAKTWHAEWMERGTAMAHGLMVLLRTVLTFGKTVLESEECAFARELLRDLKFPMPKARTVHLVSEHVFAIREEARRRGYPSIALAQAIQFDLMLRQKDVIGEWVPIAERETSDIIAGHEKWLRGIRWNEIDGNLILRHTTSKRGKDIEVDLRLAPMVMEELARFGGALPTDGPFIVCEETGKPWRADKFVRLWRQIADAVGVPRNIQQRDTRAGGITEATEAGADLELIRHAATHSDISTTQRYARASVKKTATVMQMRAAHRNKTGTSRP